MAQRVVQYQTVMQMSQSVPEIYDLPQLHRQMIEVLGVKNADKLVPLAEDMTPTDPVSENMDALTGSPLKAFIYQDHEAHIATHVAFLEDPMIAQSIGQNPSGQMVVGELQSHIAEHTAFLYRKQMEDKLGVPLPDPNAELPESMEVPLSQLMATTGAQLSQQHQAEAAQQQAEQQAQDPVVQMQQAELELKAQGEQRLKDKDAADIALAQERVDVDKRRLMVDAAKEAARIQSQNDSQNKKTDLEAVKVLLELTKAENEEERTRAEAHRDAAAAYRDDREDR